MEKEIERLRKKMVDTAAEKGLSSHETLRISRNIDDLINTYEEHLFNIKYTKPEGEE